MNPPLITMSPRGFYCAVGDFYIDPWQAVPRAVITHAHADHYAWGCGAYLVAAEGYAVFRARLGHEAVITTLAYGQVQVISGVQLSFHPAGHILGSAQIRLEYRGEVWVITGDYKTEQDRTCAPFELVRCHQFITEATFGLPIYHWQPQPVIMEQVNRWWQENAVQGRASLLYCYALGKAQRVIGNVDASIGPILAHGAVQRLNRAYRESGIALPETIYAKEANKEQIRRALIIAPTSVRGSTWVRRFGDYVSGFASGWMRIRGARRQRAVDRGFILSDHVDWDALLATIRATGAERVGVTHGYIPVVVRWLRESGLDGYGIDTHYAGDNDDGPETAEETEEA